MRRRHTGSSLSYLVLAIIFIALLLVQAGVLQIRISPQVHLPPDLQIPREVRIPPDLQIPRDFRIPSVPFSLPPFIATLVPAAGSSSPANAPTTPGGLSDSAPKPAPQEITFRGCLPEGDGGDPALNRLKNRVDEGNYIPVSFDAAVTLAWPKAIERKDRAGWASADAAQVARYEGIPISIEGYLSEARQQGPESGNCHGSTPETVDWHVWLVNAQGDDKSASIVTETTPRVRVNHPSWTLSALDAIVQSKRRVRFSGWLMFDPEHPDQVGKTRGTLWEIHPIMKMEVERDGTWVPL